MSSDWVREHKETNSTKGGLSMAGCLCCLQGERMRCCYVNVSGMFPMSSDWVRLHKETNATKGGAPIVFFCVAFRAKERGVVSLMFLGSFQCLWTGFVSTKRELRPMEVRRWRVCLCCLKGKRRGVVSLIFLRGFQCLRTGYVSTKRQLRPR
jgi:hypothetical protein